MTNKKHCIIHVRGTRVYVVRDEAGAARIKLPGDFLDITEKCTGKELQRAAAALLKHEGRN